MVPLFRGSQWWAGCARLAISMDDVVVIPLILCVLQQCNHRKAVDVALISETVDCSEFPFFPAIPFGSQIKELRECFKGKIHWIFPILFLFRHISSKIICIRSCFEIVLIVPHILTAVSSDCSVLIDIAVNQHREATI